MADIAETDSIVALDPQTKRANSASRETRLAMGWAESLE